MERTDWYWYGWVEVERHYRDAYKELLWEENDKPVPPYTELEIWPYCPAERAPVVFLRDTRGYHRTPRPDGIGVRNYRRV